MGTVKIMGLPEELYHYTRLKITKDNILDTGLTPQKPDEWKGIIPAKYRAKRVVWLKENYKKGDIIIHTGMLDRRKLYKLNLKHRRTRWWIYIGKISKKAVSV